MIEKDPGNPRIKWLRVIHLFELDYNLSLKCSGGNDWYTKVKTTIVSENNNMDLGRDTRL
jgi:hypothetical protein